MTLWAYRASFRARRHRGDAVEFYIFVPCCSLDSAAPPRHNHGEVSMMTEFRNATGADAGLISHLYATSWRKAYRGIIPPDYLERLPDDYWVPSVRTWLDSGRFSGLMMWRDGHPVGCAIYGRGRDDRYTGWGEVVSLYLLPDCTRQGLGSALLAEALRQMRADGFTRFYLWCLQNNTAADAFYRSQGFKPTSEQAEDQIGGEALVERRYVRVEA